MTKKILGWVLIILSVVILMAKMGVGITGFLIWFAIFLTFGIGIGLIRAKT